MENPATWNETQKLINAALYQNLNRQSPGSSVVSALRDNKLIKSGVEVENLSSLVDKKFDAYNKLLETGASASKQVYSMLQQLGVVS